MKIKSRIQRGLCDTLLGGLDFCTPTIFNFCEILCIHFNVLSWLHILSLYCGVALAPKVKRDPRACLCCCAGVAGWFSGHFFQLPSPYLTKRRTEAHLEAVAWAHRISRLISLCTGGLEFEGLGNCLVRGTRRPPSRCLDPWPAAHPFCWASHSLSENLPCF